MPDRKIDVDGAGWRVFPSGYITSYDEDEFGLVFERQGENAKETRVTRYSPVGSRSREQSLVELNDDDLTRLFGYSQPSDTSPEADYSA